MLWGTAEAFFQLQAKTKPWLGFAAVMAEARCKNEGDGAEMMQTAGFSHHQPPQLRRPLQEQQPAVNLSVQ